MKPIVYQSYNPLQKWVEAPLILLLGGVGYYLLELLWRGHSHFFIAVCGAICFYFVYRISLTYPHVSVIWRALLGAVFVTGVELFAGCLLNIGMGLGLWNYSDQPFQFMGQICLYYSIRWFILCLLLCGLSRVIRKKVFLSDV